MKEVDLFMSSGDEGSKERPTIFPIIIPDDADPMSDDVEQDKIDEVLPILVLGEDEFLFPSVTHPFLVRGQKNMQLLESLDPEVDNHILVTSQCCHEEMGPTSKNLLRTATLAEVMRVMTMDEDVVTIIVHGKVRVKIKDVVENEPFFQATYTLDPEKEPQEEDMEFHALSELIKESLMKLITIQGEIPMPLLNTLKQVTRPKNIINLAASFIPVKNEGKLRYLLCDDLKKRAYMIYEDLTNILNMEELKMQINMRTKMDIDKQQKEYFLQQQMRVIREELADGTDDDMSEYQRRARKKLWPKAVAEAFEKELAKLQKTPPQSPDYSIQTQYIETILDLPWDKTTKDNFDLTHAEKVLNRDHFGLEKVKERILEHLAVLKLKGDMRSPIICLYGPPGVGKTSLGKSVADALKRKYVRMSLGGLHDEAEIRGHRRTYIGAMPGRIIKGYLRAGSSNPVFVLDEVDKLASDYKGDPSSALLEVLDPEQNNAFHDNYLDIDYDLSRTLFIATANNIGDIPRPLRDRMEMIEVSGYIIDEKVEIAMRHLLPKELANHGLKKTQVKINRPTINAIIQQYTRESGVRQLEKKIAALLRKVAYKIAISEDSKKEEDTLQLPLTISPKDLKEYLGAPIFTQEQYEGNEHAGVVTGLAWTSVGGEILLIESAISPSKNGKMSITGNLGDVMKESAILALEYIKSQATLYGIPSDLFNRWNVHIHVPEGAIPKDGPSAGITLVTSLISTFTQRKVRANIAMTGEITLRGKVLPVGGIKEKILAAKRYGIKTIILCKENQKDIEEIKEEYRKGLSFVYVTDIKEVIDAALLETKVVHPIDLSIPAQETIENKDNNTVN